MCRPASSCSYTLWSLRRTAFFFVTLIGMSCKVVRKSLVISDAANRYSIVNERVVELFSVWKTWDTVCDRSLRESCKWRGYHPVSYCVSWGLLCINWNTPLYTGSLWTGLRACGIHKVRVGPATRSAVATSTAVLDWNYNHKHMEWCNKSVWAEMRLTKWKPSKNFLGLCWFKVCSYGTCHSWTFIGPLGLFNLWVLVTLLHVFIADVWIQYRYS